MVGWGGAGGARQQNSHQFISVGPENRLSKSKTHDSILERRKRILPSVRPDLVQSWFLKGGGISTVLYLIPGWWPCELKCLIIKRQMTALGDGCVFTRAALLLVSHELRSYDTNILSIYRSLNKKSGTYVIQRARKITRICMQQLGKVRKICNSQSLRWRSKVTAATQRNSKGRKYVCLCVQI